MALIIEDGSVVADANSYATAAQLKSYAELRGETVPQGLADLERLLIRAMDWVESHRARFQGSKTSSSQMLQWPRSGVTVDGWTIGANEIPRELQYAQLSAAIEAHTNDLQPNRLPTDKGAIISEKLDGVGEIKYENTGKVLPVSAFAKPDALMSPLLKRNGLSLIRA